MKPLHSEITRVRRCPCCQSKHSTQSARKQNSGKTSARHKVKNSLKKYLGY